ncbi:hypothetical protein ABK040_009372 [Willaertia magna]
MLKRSLLLASKKFCANTTLSSSFSSTSSYFNIFNSNTSSLSLLCKSTLPQQQIRERRSKQKVRRKLTNVKEIYNKFLEGPKEMYLNPIKEVKDVTKNELKPAIKEILFIRDNKLGFAGEVVKMRSAKAYTYLTSNPPKAVINNEENREKYKDLFANPEELAEKRRLFNIRYILTRCVVKMSRKTEGGNRTYYWPITKQDIANYVWKVHQVPIKSDDIIFPGEQPQTSTPYRPIKRPGYYSLYVDLHDGKRPAMLRLYLPYNDKVKTYAGKSIKGY